MELIKESCCRSRFALFISSVASRRNGEGRRCTEPSRVPVKQLKRFLKKRRLRKRIRNYVSKNVPKSSRVYQIIRIPFYRKTVVFGNGEHITEVNEFRVTKKYPLRSSCKVSLGNKMVYKSLNHKINNIASKLSGDIETNPGPFVVDASKTIHAPYSQGNSVVFGPNAGKQCVAMSLIAITGRPRWLLLYVMRSNLLLITYSNSQRKIRQIAQIRHLEPQKRQYTTIEVRLHLF